MIKNRKLILWTAAGLVILASANGWYYIHSRENAGSGGNQDGISVADNTNKSSLTRDQATTIFAKERIEFNEGCVISPNLIRVKSGTILMFDNRSRDAIAFRLDGANYTIPGYGFELLQLKSNKLPHIVKVECGDGRNTAEINLQ